MANNKPRKWKELFKEFTQDTTLHGIRYVTLDTKYFFRRIVWCLVVLVAGAVFTYLASAKLQYYYENHKTVNVEVTYQESLPFPAVTFCNQNPFRLTSLQEHGLYQEVTTKLEALSLNENTQITAGCRDSYFYDASICKLPTKVTPGGLDQIYANTTRSVCEHLCTTVHSLLCSGFFFDIRRGLCRLVSYTGNKEDKCTETAIRDGPYYYYRRKRCLELGSLDCDFEEGFCDLSQDPDHNDEWHIIQAEHNAPTEDNTMATGDGHYMYLLETGRRPEYSAQVLTPFFNTTDKCMTVFYQFLGDSASSLSVLLVAEDRSVKELVSKVNSEGEDEPFWRRLFVKYANGIHQMALVGRRGKTGGGGIAVDDLVIKPCSGFKQECIRTRLGSEYMGTRNVTVFGNKCRAWNVTGHDSITNRQLRSRLADNSLDRARNYCRHLAGDPLAFLGIGCITTEGSEEKCDVPYCPCQVRQFRCDSGFCIDQSLTCDGHAHCPDASDELAACQEWRDVTCSFEDVYQCGYTGSDFGMVTWQRIKGPGTEPGSPEGDKFGSKMGYYMILDSRITTTGDKASLLAPFTNVKYLNKQLRFNLHMNVSEFDMVASLAIRQVSELGFADAVLFEVVGNQGPGWREHTVCLPDGSYQLQFLATSGFSYRSAIALDEIIVEEQDSCTSQVQELRGSSSSPNCVFDDYCGYSQETSSSVFKWVKIAKEFVEQPEFYLYNSLQGCMDLYTTEGVIESTGYPEGYDNHVYCDVNIHSLNMTTVQLTFDKFDLEENKMMSSCYDALTLWHNPDVGMELVQYGDELCGKQLPASIAVDTQTLRLTLDTDGSIVRSGFRLHYKVADIPMTDYVMCAELKSDVVANKYHARLISPTLSLPLKQTRHCLSITFKSDGTLKIYLVCKKKNKLTQNKLYESPVMLGDTFITVEFNLHIYDDCYTDFVIVLEAVVNNDVIGCHVVLDSITLMEGTCNKTVVENGLECDFSDADSCGYHDISQGPNRWTLSRNSFGVQNMETLEVLFTSGTDNLTCGNLSVMSDHVTDVLGCSYLTVTSYELAVYFSDSTIIRNATLQSPIATIDLESCLQIVYLQDMDEEVTTFTIAVSISSTLRKDQVFLNWNYYSEDSTEESVHVALPTGRYYINITLQGSPGLNIRIVRFTLLEESCVYSDLDLRNRSSSQDDFGSGIATLAGLPPDSLDESSGDVMNSPDTSENTTILTSDISDYDNDYIYMEEDYDTYPLYPVKSEVSNPMAGNNMTYLSQLLGHQRESLIVSCRWEGEDCDKSQISPVMTELGLCYTFNRADKPLHSNRTGSRFGLQLTLNIEQYEHVTGIGSDAGLKVHLHTPDEIPSPRDLGFAVAAGMHTLIDAQFSHSVSLPQPFSNCSSRYLPYYTGQDYSISKCHLECQVNYTIKMCGCKDIYMPGPGHICNLTDYFDCILAARSLNGPMEDCECPDACELKSFGVDLSYAQLSPVNMKSHLSSADWQFILDNYHYSLETKHRVDKQLLANTITLLDDVITSHNHFESSLRFNILDEATSAMTQMTSATEELSTLVLFDIKKILFVELFSYVNDYNDGRWPWVKTVISDLQELSHILSKLQHMIYAHAAKTSSGLDQDWVDLVFSEATGLLRHVNTSLSLFNRSDHLYNDLGLKQSERLPTFYVASADSRQCNQATQNMFSKITDIVWRLDEQDFSTNSTNRTFEDYSQIVDTIGHIQRDARLLSNCYGEYGEFLDSMKTWLEQLSFEDVEMVDVDFENILGTMNSARDSLQLLRNKYSTGSNLTKLQLSNDLLDGLLLNAYQNLDTAHSQVTQLVLEPMRSGITVIESALVQAYMKALEQAETMDRYFDRKPYFEQSAKKMMIWRKPIALVETPKILHFALEADEIWKNWPGNKSLKAFLQASARAVVDELVKDYFLELRKQLSELETAIAQKQVAFKSKKENLENMLQEYKQANYIDSDFTMTNILRLDIYYGELKYEFIEQHPAYEIITFFSDMGGYLGLLLGASVITICEVLDLLIYNSLLKLSKWRNKSHVGPTGDLIFK